MKTLDCFGWLHGKTGKADSNVTPQLPIYDGYFVESLVDLVDRLSSKKEKEEWRRTQ